MVGVIVRQDNERQAILSRLLQILNAFVDAADVGVMDPAIDQDMRRAVIAWHGHQQEVAKSDPVHAHAYAQVAPDGLAPVRFSRAGPGRFFGPLYFALPSGLIRRLGWCLSPSLRRCPGRFLPAGLRNAFANSHAQYSSWSRPKLA